MNRKGQNDFQRIRKIISEKLSLSYDNQFNFFQSKPINLLVNRAELSFVILFQDWQKWDQTIQCLKRYYYISEIQSRLHKLLNHYQQFNTISQYICYQPLHQQFNPYLVNYQKKKRQLQKKSNSLNLQDSKQTSQAKSSYQFIIPLLKQDLLEMIQRESQLQKSQQESFDSTLHQVYEDSLVQQQSVMRSKQGDIEELMIDFKERELIFQKKQKQQFNKLEIYSEIRNSEKDKNKSKGRDHHSKDAIIEKLINVNQGLRIQNKKLKANQNKKNDYFEKEINKKSFMDYYNSVPAKNPSNILQRYIQKKRI